jgi:hypothetical protein
MLKPWLSHLWHTAVRILCGLLFLALVLLVKVSYGSRQELSLGTEADARGEYTTAITHYERAIKWYTPFSRSVRLAVKRLWTLGAEAERREDLSLALDAYWSLRRSLYAVQSLYLPYRDWMPRIEERIAMLMAKTAQPEGQGGEKLTQNTARITHMLQRNTSPTLGGSILVELGFLGWVGTAMGFIWSACCGHGRRTWQQGVLWGGGIVVFFGVWIVGMLLA